MIADVKNWVAECEKCQETKVIRHIRTQIASLEIPPNRFLHIHLDLIGELPLSNGHSFILTIVDRFTRYADAIPLVDATAKSVLDGFTLSWVSRLGVPQKLVTDNAMIFQSEIWRETMEFLGIEHKFSLACMPAQNGLVERFNKR